MITTTLYVLASVLVVSLISFVGAFTLLSRWKKIDHFLLILVSISAGTLFGGAFLHLLPEAIEKNGPTSFVFGMVMLGIIVFFLLDKFIHWHHCHPNPAHAVHHHQVHKTHSHSHLAPLNLVGDALHNFLDGLVIAGSYLISVPVGVATTIAVVLHEVPQEIADFGVLLYAGLSRRKALFLNFLSGAVAIVGAIVGLALGTRSEVFLQFILPFAAGGFVYIAGSNLIPELHKECGLKDSFWHFFALLLGMVLMYLMTFLG
ncbi:TPA: ZIP family metal transporter [Candidatus Woesearchaeota archaeon]|nr:ZIP family metal transporter [Candidatus Woesearchaeota archaeon]